MNRIKSLDGMRAISIIMVLLDHAEGTFPAAIRHSRLFHFFYSFFADGKLGVSIFFVISGYLITKLLIIERKKTGHVSIKDFYIRRILRIFPVFYLYIIVLIVLKTFFIPTLFENYTLVGFAALYLWNYQHLFPIHRLKSDNATWFFGHFWTLSMEEQFYLLWPITFTKISTGTLKKVIIVIILSMPFVRLASYFFMPGSRGQISMMLHTSGFIILVGCLGALIENTSFFKERITPIINNNYLIGVIAVFLFIVSPLLNIRFGGIYDVPIGSTLNSLGIIIILFWSMYVPSKVSDFLNNKIVIQIGILSYSLYIWQQLFLNNKIHFWFNQFPQNIFLVFAVGFISYYGIEKPILQLKKRFIRI
jgi:peptidoglycan/LPS O-acetylase OafA/YrhL